MEKMKKTLKETIVDLGFNQREFAELCGLDASTISGYCSGKSYPKVSTKDKIASALGMVSTDIDWGDSDSIARQKENQKQTGGAFRQHSGKKDILRGGTKERELFASNVRNLMFKQHLNFEEASRRSGLKEKTIRVCFDPSVNIEIKTASLMAMTLGTTYDELTTKDLFNAFPKHENKESVPKPVKTERRTYRTHQERKAIDTSHDYDNDVQLGRCGEEAKKMADMIAGVSKVSSDATDAKKDGELYLSYDEVLNALDKIASRKRREIVDMMASDTKVNSEYLELKRESLDILQFEIPAMICQLAKEK